jgi:hypothetical protein
LWKLHLRVSCDALPYVGFSGGTVYVDGGVNIMA